jgi:P-type Cu+ transporter
MELSVALRLDLPLEGMTGAACAARIEKSLNKLAGVTANVNFAAESALVTVQRGATSPADNALGIPLAAAGMLNPVIAGAAMALSSVSVVSNSLLLRRWRRRKGYYLFLKS